MTHHHHLVELARRVDINPPTITTLAPPPNLQVTRDAQYIRAATPPVVSLRRIPAPRGHAEDPGRVRTWARENGLDVAERGRLPAEILDAYRRAGSAAPEIA